MRGQRGQLCSLAYLLLGFTTANSMHLTLRHDAGWMTSKMHALRMTRQFSWLASLGKPSST